MNTQNNIEERLWEYIDGTCQQQEKGFIEELIATQELWRNKYHELLDLQQLMSQSLELDEPSMRFSQNVMEQIARFQIAPATKTYINKRIIYGIGLFFLATIAGFLIYSFGQVNLSHSSGGAITRFTNEYSNKLDWSKVFNNTYTNIFLMVNVVMGLMLLDMYLGKKRKELQQKQA